MNTDDFITEINKITLNSNEALWIKIPHHVNSKELDTFIEFLNKRLPESITRRMVFSPDNVELMKICVNDKLEKIQAILREIN